MNEKRETPRNELEQPPTRTPEETEARLREKKRSQRGAANRRRIEEQIREVRD
jgi:hypothetical protein